MDTLALFSYAAQDFSLSDLPHSSCPQPGSLSLGPEQPATGKLVFYRDKELNCLEGWEIAEGSSGAASLRFPWQYPNVRMGLIKTLFHQFLVLLKATSEGKQKE